MHRFAAILLTGWVLLGAPMLCMAGLLEHNCACQDCCESKPHSCTQNPCSQGHTCEGDPCDTDLIRARSGQTADQLELFVQADAIIIAVIEPPTLAVDILNAPDHEIRPRLSSSFAERGLPLLN